MGTFGADFGFISDIGGKAKGNEDSAFFQQFNMIFAPGSPKAKAFTYNVILAIVCDGVSGSVKGEEGSTFGVRTLAHKIISHLLLKELDLAQIQPTLEKLIQETNSELLKTYDSDVKAGKIPKSTLVGVLVIGQYLWAFNLGDSRCYLIRDGQIGQVSVDHIGTANHEITQALGEKSVHPHIYPFLWAFNDAGCQDVSFKESFQFLICSDGLTDKVSADEINSTLAGSEKLQPKVEKLYDLTMSRGIDDNVSIIAVDLADYFSHLSKVQIIRLKPR
jgi:protein phosphatase